MKTKITLLLAVVIFLCSCGTKFSLQKRRYNKGFYVAKSHSNSNKKDELKSSAKFTSSIPEIKSQTVIQSSQPKTELPKEIIRITNLEKIAYNSTQAATKNQTKSKGFASSAKKIIFRDVEFRNMERVNLGSVKKDSSKVNLVLMVILCLFPFINLIPVYLHDDDVTLNFWLTLILDFLWIPGVVFAILVVLDVVDLR
jgi:uncharacterized membrane protein YqaE (UPF0057 family)